MKKLFLFLLLSSSMLFACSETSSYDNNSAPEAKMVAQTEESGSYKDAKSIIDDRKIIKTADYRIQVKNMDHSTDNIKVLLKTHGAYLSRMDVTTTSYSVNNEMSIRVPNEKFEILLNSIGDEAISTQYKRINARDVTEEFVDIEIRLATKTEVRDRYIEILRDKASTVDEVLNAEEKIRRLTEEIEAKKGRLRYLKDQVAMSTINLEIYQKIPYQAEIEAKPSFFSRLGKSLKNGWEGILEFAIILANLWPLLILIVLVIWRTKLFSRFTGKKETSQ